MQPETKYAKSGDVNIAYRTNLAAGSGIGFEDRSHHTLKGVPEQWRLLAVERGSSVAQTQNVGRGL